MLTWPDSIWFIRHAESVGNVANAAAMRDDALRLEISVNDVDVELSERGAEQAAAVGRWLHRQPATELPTVAFVSPYHRAQQTLQLILDAAGLTLPTTVDERLRDREQGWLDRYTGRGIREDFPEEAERRSYLGKFWYRPPGGESWADVALRLRAFLTELRLAQSGQRVLVVSHDVPIIIARYVLEGLTADEAIALSAKIANCSVTKYAAGPDEIRLEAFNDVDAVSDVAVTKGPQQQDGSHV